MEFGGREFRGLLFITSTKEFGKDTFGKAAHLTEETVRTAADEAKQLSKRALDIARGTVYGILQGAKHALRKDKEDK
jgi:hypothetical protein